MIETPRHRLYPSIYVGIYGSPNQETLLEHATGRVAVALAESRVRKEHRPIEIDQGLSEPSQ
jgi:hypothetical protein